MRFQTPLLLIASLITFVSGEAAGTRSHPRDLSVENIVDGDIMGHSQRVKRNPVLPPGKDDTKLHVWVRTDKETVTYDSSRGVNHEGLNQMMKDIGGNHVDVVIGNSHGYHEVGLQFANKDWIKKHPNGDGAEIADYWENYITMPQETFEYRGQIDGRKTIASIQAAAKKEISGKTYNHQTYNCKTYALEFVKTLNAKV
ncbi:hypothetical protein F4781DRAFT_396449 [Annulohypoxylon bovei var. microspora]|nr:hypothetical protein F4781DRAFT_396449 [Annulohypoxylon bovei var. microspora]